MPALRPTTDGVVTIRPPEPGDAATLIAGRDDVFHRFLGPGSDDPDPVGCIVVDGAVVGWVDHDVDRSWLEPGEVNLGYNVVAPARGRGYATRAVQLLMHHLAVDTPHRTATVLIDPQNERSLALARRAGFAAWGDLDGNPYGKRSVPPLAYSDGVVTIRRQEESDLEADLASKDDEQIGWLWLPGQRESWDAMDAASRRDHALRGLRSNRDAFGSGPRWTFAVDAAVPYVAYVECDLANANVPHGEANISYSSHPDHRGKGYARRSVELVLSFLRDHTAARTAHLIVDAANTPSRRVAASVDAVEVERWTVEGRTMIRHVRTIPRP
jgi:RimJ/RimL family protein N-acetyltransferase